MRPLVADPLRRGRQRRQPAAAGTTRRVSGRLLGVQVRLDLETLVADPACLRLRAHGPIEIVVDYTLEPTQAGCAVEALVVVRPRSRHTPVGRLLGRATGLLLATGTLDHALERMAHEAERPVSRRRAGVRARRRGRRGPPPLSVEPSVADLSPEDPGEAPPAGRRSEAELVAEPARQLAQQLRGIDAELPEQLGVLLGIDLVGKLLVGLLGLVVLAAIAQEREDLVLGDLHARSLPGRAAANL